LKIVFIGAPGSGKSTLATSVFTALKIAGHSTELVHEWIRYEIQSSGPMTSIWEQYRTRQYQKDLEDAVPPTVKYVVCDSGTISAYFYAVLYSDPNEPRQRLVLQDMYKYLLDDLYLRRYDMIFYLPAVVNPDTDDGTRYQTEAEITALDQHMHLFFTTIHRLPEIYCVSSDLKGRLQEVVETILAVDAPSMTNDLRVHVATLIKNLQNSED
jgi:nicotinamide riboside kinase